MGLCKEVYSIPEVVSVSCQKGEISLSYIGTFISAYIRTAKMQIRLLTGKSSISDTDTSRLPNGNALGSAQRLCFYTITDNIYSKLPANFVL